MEHHGLVDAVQELRPEVHLQLAPHRLADQLRVLPRHLHDEVGAEVAGHHDHGVLEVHRAALSVGQTAVVQHLQQHVEHIRVGLLDLVEQQHAVGLAAHRLGQVAALVVADIARRRADQARDRVLLHELAHVDADHGFLGVEQETGQCLAQLGLADAGGAEEQEGACGAIRVGQAGPRTADRIGHGADRLVLPHHALVQLHLHVEQLLPLALHQLGDRDAGGARHHLGDLFGADQRAQQRRLAVDPALGLLGLRVLELLLQLRQLAVLQLGDLVEVALALELLDLRADAVDVFLQVRRALGRGLLGLPHLVQIGRLALELRDVLLDQAEALLRGLVLLLAHRLALDLQLDQPAVELVHHLGLGVDLDLDLGRGLVDQVDGLVGQEAVGDVAVAQLGGGHDRRVGDLHAVVDLVLLLQTAQDGDGGLDARFTDQHLLEAALERRVLLDVLAVLVERGGADAVQLAARQRGLQHVAGVDRTFGLAGAHHGVDLVDEDDGLALVLRHFLQHALEPLLELAAVLGARQQQRHVEHQHALALERLRHLAGHDALRQALDDGGLADAGLADQHRVVLGAPLQHLDRAADLVVAADHRIELAGTGALGQVDRVLLQRLALAHVLCVDT
eukprot:Opistho-1_new@106316